MTSPRSAIRPIAFSTSIHGSSEVRSPASVVFCRPAKFV